MTPTMGITLFSFVTAMIQEIYVIQTNFCTALKRVSL